MKFIFLGSGTSTGVPQLRCGCSTCTSADSRDRRMRASGLIETTDGHRLLIDCGPDFHEQMIRHGRRSPLDHIDALIVTHQHYDHVGGLDDLRPYCYNEHGPFDFPVYCQPDVARDLRDRMPYSFSDHPYPGAPRYDLREITPMKSFEVCGLTVLPVPVNHYILEIVGFRIGAMAYITDAKKVPDITVEALRGIDTLIINALRQKPHMSHMTLQEAIDVAERISPRVTYITHISHDMGRFADVEPMLPPGVHLATDDLTINIPD